MSQVSIKSKRYVKRLVWDPSVASSDLSVQNWSEVKAYIESDPFCVIKCRGAGPFNVTESVDCEGETAFEGSLDITNIVVLDFAPGVSLHNPAMLQSISAGSDSWTVPPIVLDKSGTVCAVMKGSTLVTLAGGTVSPIKISATFCEVVQVEGSDVRSDEPSVSAIDIDPGLFTILAFASRYGQPDVGNNAVGGGAGGTLYVLADGTTVFTEQTSYTGVVQVNRATLQAAVSPSVTASNARPADAVEGQINYNSTDKVNEVFDGTTWRGLGYRERVIFRPGVPSGDNHFETWQEVFEYAMARKGCAIAWDSTHATALIPSGDYDCQGQPLRFESLDSSTLQTVDGVQFQNCAGAMFEGVGSRLQGAPTIKPMFDVTSFGLFIASQGSGFQSDAGATQPFISAANGATAICVSDENGSFDNSGSGVPIIHAQNGSQVYVAELNCFSSGQPPANLVSSDPGALVILAFDLNSPLFQDQTFCSPGTVARLPISNLSRAIWPYGDNTGETALEDWQAGTLRYNTDLSALRVWTGTAWQTVASGGGGGGDATSIQSVPVSATPPTGDGAVPTFDGIQYVARRLTLDDIDPAFAISSFSGGNQTLEVGDTIASPVVFSNSYTAPPTAAEIQDNQGNPLINLSSPYTSGSYPHAYTKTANNSSVVWTLTAHLGALLKTLTNTANWRPRVYYGVAPIPGTLDSAFMLSLSGNALASSVARTINYSAAGPLDYFWYLLPTVAPYGVPGSATMNGLPFSFVNHGSFSYTNIFGVTQNYYAIRSNLPNIGANPVIWSP